MNRFNAIWWTALAFILMVIAACAQDAPPIPDASRPWTNYFAMTAVGTDGTESLFSNETNFVGPCQLAYSNSISPNIAYYKLYVGHLPGAYTRSFKVTTNVVNWPQDVMPVRIVFIHVQGGEVMQSTTNGIDWTDVATNYVDETFIGPAGNKYFRTRLLPVTIAVQR